MNSQKDRIKIVDAHVDIPDMYACFNYKYTDFLDEKSDAPVTLKKLQDADIDIVGFSLYFDKSLLKTTFYDGVKGFYDFYQKILRKTDKLHRISSKDDLENKSEECIGFIYSIEGFECFRTLEDFDEFYNLGVRVFGFTWDYVNDYAYARKVEEDEGLTVKGKLLVKKMNERRLILDIAHLSENSVKDLDRYFKGTIVSTHSNVRKVCDKNHNLTDDEINIIVERDGVVSLFPIVADTGGKGTFEDLYRHVEYIAGKWGDNYVAFSSDIYPLPEYPFIGDHKDILIMKSLKDFLLTKCSREEVKKIMYDNWLRVLRNSL
ncbi:membrane dipeptidase [Candidatus Dojkabacteria bacterium]|nr:membrane dipeptidase [Candidatus Dojkabacteria bacterium]